MSTTALREVTLTSAYAGNDHTIHVTAPVELGDISTAGIWFTLRDSSGAVVHRARNLAAGGSEAQAFVTSPGGGGLSGTFDVHVLPGATTNLLGTYRYEIYIEIDGQNIAQTLALGNWTILKSITDTSV